MVLNHLDFQGPEVFHIQRTGSLADCESHLQFWSSLLYLAVLVDGKTHLSYIAISLWRIIKPLMCLRIHK